MHEFSGMHFYFVPFCFSFFYFHVTKMLYEMNDVNSPQWHEINQYPILLRAIINYYLIFSTFHSYHLFTSIFQLVPQPWKVQSSFQWVEDNYDPIIRYNSWIASLSILCWTMILFWRFFFQKIKYFQKFQKMLHFSWQQKIF